LKNQRLRLLRQRLAPRSGLDFGIFPVDLQSYLALLTGPAGATFALGIEMNRLLLERGTSMTRALSSFATGRFGGGSEPKRLEYSTKTGVLSVADVEPDPRGGYTKQLTPLRPGHKMVVGTHSIFHGYCEFTPKFQQRMQPWSPGAPVLPQPDDWDSPIEAIKLPFLVEAHGPLWLLLSAVIPMNALKDFLDRISWTPEAQQGLVPLTALAEPRTVTLRDRPGEVFYSPLFAVERWVGVEEARLGPRVTAVPAIAGEQMQRPALPQTPTTPGQPPTSTAPAQRPPPPLSPAAAAAPVSNPDPPWEMPEPKPLPPVQPAPSAAAEPQLALAAAPSAPAHDPFEVFRRR
jgi:hypothetical protein